MNRILRSLLCLFCFVPAVHAATFAGVIPGAGLIHVQSHSLRSLRFVHLVRQRTDFSCGAAALATILRYGYHRDVTEQGILQGLYQVSDPAVVRKEGFSLMDIKRYVARIGLQGAGFRVNAAALPRIKVPTIVLLNLGGYEHFVVLRKVVGDTVFLADPALGQRTVSVAEFTSEWNGIIFAVLGHGYDPRTILRHPRPPLGVSQLAAARAATGANMLDFGINAGLF